MGRIEEGRLELHKVLVSLLGSKNVYFQPPESLKLSYPCIVYSRDTVDQKYADDTKYLKQVKYSVTVVDKDPDSKIVDRINDSIDFKFVRHYISDNLNHDVFTVYY